MGSIGQEEVNDRVTLTSSNPKVAVIDEAGKLKAIGFRNHHHDNSGSEGGSGEAEGDDECEGCRPPGGEIRSQ